MEELNNLNKKLNKLEQDNKVTKIFQTIDLILIIIGISGYLFNFKTVGFEIIFILVLLYFQSQNMTLNKKINVLTNTIKEIATKNS